MVSGDPKIHAKLLRHFTQCFFKSCIVKPIYLGRLSQWTAEVIPVCLADSFCAPPRRATYEVNLCRQNHCASWIECPFQILHHWRQDGLQASIYDYQHPDFLNSSNHTDIIESITIEHNAYPVWTFTPDPSGPYGCSGQSALCR